MGLRKDHWMLRLPQGPRHSAQGDHADQPQFTEKGGHESGLGEAGQSGGDRGTDLPAPWNPWPLSTFFSLKTMQK